ncbi:MAG: Uma2 family endonuclease [Blastocatellia bacterium]
MSILTQTDLPRPARETLPTMYDLPSEESGEPGMPDEYHPHQAVLLSETFHPATVPPDEVFTAIDLNLYYDLQNPRWYKRPDWFAAIGVPSLYEGHDLRLSYVIWQEEVTPLIIVELLSEKTQKADLGQTLRDEDGTPTKWEVYERILRVPYYAVFSRVADRLRIFKLNGGSYTEVVGHGDRFWLPEAGLGLGVWRGVYKGPERLWLRWYDAQGNWIPTNAERFEQERERAEQERERAEAARKHAEQERERAEQERERAKLAQLQLAQERQRAEAERERAERLAEMLRQLGKDPDQL